ncbi:MAG: tetratricopeptide repeat protein [Planctomycetia bacterium]|nr:tetratricopeptide repeat protein [Planctomycetia bacterium]
MQGKSTQPGIQGLKLLLGCLTVVLLCTGCSHPSPYRVGDRVVAISYASLTIDGKKVGNAIEGESLTVLEVSGDQIRIEGSGRGWLDAKFVVSVEHAFDYYTQRLQQKPDDSFLFSLSFRAEGALKEKKYDRAIADYTDLIRLQPKHAFYWCDRGFARMKKGDSDGAIEDFTAAVNLDRNNPKFFSGRAYAREEKKDYDGAIADMDKAIGLNPKRSIYYRIRGELRLKNEDYNGAIADFNDAIQFDPKSGRNFVARALARSKLEDYDGASQDLNKGIQLDPDEPVAYRRLARLMSTCPDAKYRNGDKAVQYATRAIQLRGDQGNNDGTYLGTLAAAYAEVGNFDEAVKWQTKANESYSPEQKKKWGFLLDLYKSHKPYRDEIKKK